MNLIINFTPTGMIPTKDMTHHVPISVSEIVEDVHQPALQAAPEQMTPPLLEHLAEHAR